METFLDYDYYTEVTSTLAYGVKNGAIFVINPQTGKKVHLEYNEQKAMIALVDEVLVSLADSDANIQISLG